MTRPAVTHLPLGLGEPSAASHGERETATSTRRRGAGRRKSQRPPFCIWWRETLPQSPAATLPTPVLEGESCTERLASSEPACSTRHGPRLPKNGPRGDAGGMQSSPRAALFLGLGKQSWLVPFGLLGRAHQPRQSSHNMKRWQKTGFVPSS